MAQPQAYSRTVDFTERDGDETNHAGINAELDAVALPISQIRDNLALIQKDDGTLANGVVGADQLAASAFDAVASQVAQATQDAQDAANSAIVAATTASTASTVAVAAKDQAVTANNAAQLNAQSAAASATAAAASAAIASSDSVKTTSDQTVAGVKTFTSNPISTDAQSAAANSLVRRDFVTGLDAGNVKTTGDQTIAGVKTFTNNNINIAGLGIGGAPVAKLDVFNGSTVTRSSPDGYTTFKTFNGANPFTTNYDRYQEAFDSGSQVYVMGTAHGGTGLPRALGFMVGNAERMRINTDGSASFNHPVTAPQFNGSLNGNAATATTAATVSNDAITTAKIANGAVTAAKIANGAVGSSQLAALGVADANIASMSASKLTGSLPTSQVLSAVAGAAVGAVGTYAFLRALLTTIYTPGATAAGSSLAYSHHALGAYGGSPAGTWMCMGHVEVFYFDDFNNRINTSGGSSVWLRIS
ncbi:MAG: hypothetical protein ACKOF9_04345 [Burkholderiales bacterium]